jgi:ATP-dependent Lon protease
MGMRTVILPKDNEKDLAEIPAEIQAGLAIRFVENMDEVLAIALERPLASATHDAVPEVAAKFETETESDQELTN